MVSSEISVACQSRELGTEADAPIRSTRDPWTAPEIHVYFHFNFLGIPFLILKLLWFFSSGYFIFLEADAVNTESIFLRIGLNPICSHYTQFAYFIYGAHTRAIFGETFNPSNRQRNVLFSIFRNGGKPSKKPSQRIGFYKKNMMKYSKSNWNLIILSFFQFPPKAVRWSRVSRANVSNDYGNFVIQFPLILRLPTHYLPNSFFDVPQYLISLKNILRTTVSVNFF